jgi:hypothetical protein
MSEDTTTSEPFRLVPCTNGDAISSRGETHARRIARPEDPEEQGTRVRQFTSSALLTYFARRLFSVRIQRDHGQMLLGLGGDFDASSSVLATLSCPSDSGPVALALTTDAIGCSCSPSWPTPCARDWKGKTPRSSSTVTIPDKLGGDPHPEFYEELMGFPIGWTALEHSEMPSSPRPEN